MASRKLSLFLSVALFLVGGALAVAAWSVGGRLSSRPGACQAPAGMMDRLLCWFLGIPREKPTPPKTRLTPEEAIALAQAAVGPTSELSQLALATFEQRQGRGVWHVTPPIAMGAMLFVDVDDATGEILAKGVSGTR